MKIRFFAALHFVLFISCFSLTAFAESASVTLQSLRSMEAGTNRPENQILIGNARARNCRQVLNICNSCTNDRTLLAWKQTYQIVAQQCAQEQQTKGCNQLVAREPKLRGKMLDCSAQAVCERQDFVLNLEDTIRGCFWNAPKAFDMDIWNMITQTPGALGNAFMQCYGHPNNLFSRFISAMKCQSPLYYIIKGSQSLANANFRAIYQKGREWVTKQGVKMSCYSPEAQTEMICYGILNVIVPTKIGKLKDIPEVVRLSGLAQRGERAAAAGVRSEGGTVARAAGADASRARTPAPRTPAPTPEAPRRPVARRTPAPTPAPTARRTAVAAAGAAAVKSDGSAARAGTTEAAAAAERTSVLRSRRTFTEEFVNRNATTEAQNQAWVDFANAADTSPGTKFVDMENSAMKKLNDTTLDKNFVTALTNQHKQIVLEKMTALQSRFPQVEFIPYSDFKSMRFALKPKPPLTKLPDGLEAEISKAFQQANSEFARVLEAKKVVPDGQNAATWFRAGFGSTADEASLASRYARGASGANEMHIYGDATMMENLDVARKSGEMFRSNLERDLASTNLMEASSVAGKKIPRREVFDAVRKTQTNAQLQDFIKKTTGETITLRQASEIRTYAELVDEFSPGIHVARREVASLAESSAGGFSIDFAGMGSYNGQATADGLVRASDIGSALRETRVGERAVTAEFNRKKRAVTETVNRVLNRNGITSEIIASGDDMVVRPSKPIPAEVRAEIARELATEVDPASIRMSHVGPDIRSGSERMIMATIGEACEKMIRKLARALMSPEKLNKVLILVEVTGTNSSNFSTNLVLGEGSANLTPAERQSIQSASDQALAVKCK